MKNVKEILAGKKRKHQHHHAHSGSSQTVTHYQCPMKCEGEKTYEKPGDCPVCNMHLAPVE